MIALVGDGGDGQDAGSALLYNGGHATPAGLPAQVNPAGGSFMKLVHSAANALHVDTSAVPGTIGQVALTPAVGGTLPGQGLKANGDDGTAPHLVLEDPTTTTATFTVHETGTVVVIQGPRFSTRAESRWFSSLGWEVINMTQYPEVVLARELELCYVNLSLITDYDVGLEGQPGVRPVSVGEVESFFASNNDRVRALILSLIPKLPAERSCPCSSAMRGAVIGADVEDNRDTEARALDNQ